MYERSELQCRKRSGLLTSQGEKSELHHHTVKRLELEQNSVRKIGIRTPHCKRSELENHRGVGVGKPL